MTFSELSRAAVFESKDQGQFWIQKVKVFFAKKTSANEVIIQGTFSSSKIKVKFSTSSYIKKWISRLILNPESESDFCQNMRVFESEDQGYLFKFRKKKWNFQNRCKQLYLKVKFKGNFEFRKWKWFLPKDMRVFVIESEDFFKFRKWKFFRIDVSSCIWKWRSRVVAVYDQLYRCRVLRVTRTIKVKTKQSVA